MNVRYEGRMMDNEISGAKTLAWRDACLTSGQFSVTCYAELHEVPLIIALRLLWKIFCAIAWKEFYG